MALTRKEFLQAVAVLVGGTAASAMDCPGDPGNPPPDGGDGGQPDGGDGGYVCNTVNSVIGLNHTAGPTYGGPHTLTVTKADAEAGVNKTYSLNLLGYANHDHSLTVTAANFATLLTGAQVMVTSSITITGIAHDHEVIINCV